MNVREVCPPIREKRRGQELDRNKAIQEEVAKLVVAHIMREVHYHSWLANPIMVKKHDDSWRMCVDFTDLNKACPKDCYPLLEIDWKIEPLCGYPFKCFLDAYKGYHQIQMAEEDEEKTTFHTSQGVYCYTKILFDLKNVRATYQRPVDKAFEKQIGRNLEVYVDDLVIKSHTQDILKDIKETFQTLRKINMKLNPKNCTFGAEEGVFLGHIVNMKGIKACPEKEKAVIKLQSPRTLKEVQSLNGKLASLNREAVSAVLLTERDSQQMPVYSFSRALQTPEVNCSSMEKPDKDGSVIETQVEETIPDPWTLFMDGSSCLGGSGDGLILTNPEGVEFTYALREVLAVLEEEGDSWMTPLLKYLTNSRLPAEVPFKLKAQGKVKFLIVAIDYFTKWIEAKPVATITGNQVKKFVWDTIVGRFGLTGEVISENRKQFKDNPFKDWWKEQTAAWEKELRQGWVEKTSIRSRSTEAVIQVEIGMPSLRCAEIDQAINDKALLLNLDVLEEEREKAVIQEAKSKMKRERYYNAKVRGTIFKPGDFVYRSNESSYAMENWKLGPK
ncbi:reverse transcriptase domain-containing protein [Tanacetum coccineum]